MQPDTDKPESNTDTQTNITPPTPPVPAPPTPAPTPTFTQADVDRISGNARKEGREKAVADLFADVGVKDKGELATLVKSIKEREEAELSEKQKLEKKLADLEAAKQAAEERVKTIELQRVNDKRNATLKDALVAKNPRDIDDLLILVMQKFADKITAVFDVTDKPDEANKTKLEALITEIITSQPSYFPKPGIGSPSNQFGIPPTSKERAKEIAERELRKII